MNEKVFLLSTVLIVAIAAVSAHLIQPSATGNVASNAYYNMYGSGYSPSKVYGGAIRSTHRNPMMYGRGAAEQLQQQKIQQVQNYLLANKDKWQCTYNEHEAITANFPCMKDEKTNKYCCIPDWQ